MKWNCYRLTYSRYRNGQYLGMGHAYFGTQQTARDTLATWNKSPNWEFLEKSIVPVWRDLCDHIGTTQTGQLIFAQGAGALRRLLNSV